MSNTDLDLGSRVKRLGDRTAISEVVIRYAVAIDRADWDMLAGVLTDPVHVDFSDAGMPPGDFSSDSFVNFASAGLSGFTARQHLSPNHAITFDDEDHAVCLSYMYAQHYLEGAERGDFFLMRGSYTNRLVCTPQGWKIAHVTQHVSWNEGNLELPALASAAHAAPQPTWSRAAPAAGTQRTDTSPSIASTEKPTVDPVRGTGAVMEQSWFGPRGPGVMARFTHPTAERRLAAVQRATQREERRSEKPHVQRVEQQLPDLDCW